MDQLAKARHIDLTRDDHAYFFGFFQADGHLGAGPGRKGKASIEVSERDESTLRDICALFPAVRSTVSRRVRRTNFAECHRAATWTAHAEPFRAELVALGIPEGPKSFTAAPPVEGRPDREGIARG